MKKGQSAIEFLILVGAVLFFFLTFLFVIQSNLADKFKENKNTVVHDVALTVQEEINLAAKSSDGYSREFDLPLELLGEDYLINITAQLVYVRTASGGSAIALPVTNSTGQPVKGTNLITRINGSIYLNS